jgi:hypothetical protein
LLPCDLGKGFKKEIRIQKFSPFESQTCRKGAWIAREEECSCNKDDKKNPTIVLKY